MWCGLQSVARLFAVSWRLRQLTNVHEASRCASMHLKHVAAPASFRSGLALHFVLNSSDFASLNSEFFVLPGFCLAASNLVWRTALYP